MEEVVTLKTSKPVTTQHHTLRSQVHSAYLKEVTVREVGLILQREAF